MNKNENFISLLTGISLYRDYLMGVAILMVLIYHMLCWVYNPIGEFNIGYVGVDVFYFLSGYGLSYSYSKNRLNRFYTNRFKRLYPLYFISVITSFFIIHSQPVEVLFNNLLTLGYYFDNGINRFDWYIESLFAIYALFPILYYCGRNWGGTFLSFLLISLVIYTMNNIEWWYICLMARIPIFMLGISFANHDAKKFSTTTIYGLIVVSLLIYYPCFVLVSKFLASSLLVIPIILLALLLLQMVGDKIYFFLEYVGKHSLELYLANILLMYTMQACPQSIFIMPFYYVFLQVLYSWILICVGRYINLFFNYLDDLLGHVEPSNKSLWK